jgi:hypothetical protein
VLRLYCCRKLPCYRFFEMAAKLRKRELGNRFLYLLKIPLDHILQLSGIVLTLLVETLEGKRPFPSDKLATSPLGVLYSIIYEPLHWGTFVRTVGRIFTVET